MARRSAGRLGVLTVALAATVLGLVGAALAYVPGPFIECTDMTPGETVVCRAHDLEPGETVEVEVTLLRVVSGTQASAGFTLAATVAFSAGVPAETLLDDRFTADGNGQIDFAFGIPADAEEGDEVVIEIAGVGFAVFQVTADDEDAVAPVTPRPGPAVTQLPRTGLEFGVLLAIGIAALVVGGGVLVAARRRGDAVARRRDA